MILEVCYLTETTADPNIKTEAQLRKLLQTNNYPNSGEQKPMSSVDSELPMRRWYAKMKYLPGFADLS